MVDWLNALDLSPEAQHALGEMSTGMKMLIRSLLLPTAFLYFALWLLVKGRMREFKVTIWFSIFTFLLNSWIMVVQCSALRSMQLFAVAIGTMKALDIYVRRHSPPEYAHENRPSDAILGLLLLTELRYESFVPNHVGTAPAPQSTGHAAPELTVYKRRFKLEFSEPVNLALHGLLFSILQVYFPQYNPTVLALQVLLAIYVIWESLQLLVRYRTSPPLFGPIYKASSLGSFWSETWHSAFASPCRSLAYEPVRQILPRYGIPVSFARGIGILASFALMGCFHVFGLAPLLPLDALLRILAFFLLNGVGAVIESALWGKRSHWGKTLLAWTFELAIASWTVEGLSVPRGLRELRWGSICDVGRDSRSLFRGDGRSEY